jgi:hydrogenase maturation protease
MNSPRVVVIAYGNPLRGDDGLAWRAGDELRKKIPSPDVEIVQRHQLTPELAEDIRQADAVILVDTSAARVTNVLPGEIRIVEIGQQETSQATGSAFHHQFSPASLLALVVRLYGARPRAFVATLAGENFGPSECLSPAVERAIPEFVERIEKLIMELGVRALDLKFRPKT